MTATGWARLSFDIGDAASAEAAARALAPENGPHCRTWSEGAVVHCEVPEARLGSFAMTVDDVLACLGAVDRAQEAVDV